MSSQVCSVVVAGGLRLERLDGVNGAELALCDANGARVHRLSGAAAERLEAVRRADGASVVADDAVTAALLEAGVLEVCGPDGGVGPDPMSRRRMLGLAGGAAAVGVTTMLLPSAAAAASGGGPDGVGSPGTLWVTVFDGGGTLRQFSIYWGWDGATTGSPYSYTIDPGITRTDGVVNTGSSAASFNAGFQFTFDTDTAGNSGSRVITATWFGDTRVINIPDIQTVDLYINP
jgi:hypothetical protein